MVEVMKTSFKRSYACTAIFSAPNPAIRPLPSHTSTRDSWTPMGKSGSVSKKQESSQKNIYFCFIDYAKAFDCVDHNKPWKILHEMGIPDHLTCLLRNLYVGQDATVRTGHG